MYFGSAEKLNRDHLKRLKKLVKRTGTPWLTDHLCWGSVDGRYTHDLLPMPYTFEAAKITARKIREARDYLEVPIAVENVSSYAEFHVSEMTEWEFLNEVVERADCGILLDVNNIYVSSQNHNFDPFEYLDSVPADRVAQIHIAGHSKFEKYILDTHDHPVIDPVWKMYDIAIRRTGPTATLLEWDDQHSVVRRSSRGGAEGGAILACEPSGRRMSLLQLQRRMAEHLMRPLTPSDNIAPRTADGKSMRREAAEFIKPNDRLSSIERLEIYNRQYWFRVLDSMYEDFPGLRAIVGQRAFHRLSAAYIAECSSRSFSLRDLGSRLEEWLRRNPSYAPQRHHLALDMVRLEWAHINAWDGAAEKALGPEDLLELGPSLRVRLQPYIALLSLSYPVDDLLVQLTAGVEDHGTASNAVRAHRHRAVSRVRKLQPQQLFVAVHRLDFTIYYRRLEPEEFLLLEALRHGKPVGKAIGQAFAGSAVPPDLVGQKLESWFAAWAEFGWLCPAPKRGTRT